VELVYLKNKTEEMSCCHCNPFPLASCFPLPYCFHKMDVVFEKKTKYITSVCKKRGTSRKWKVLLATFCIFLQFPCCDNKLKEDNGAMLFGVIKNEIEKRIWEIVVGHLISHFVDIQKVAYQDCRKWHKNKTEITS